MLLVEQSELPVQLDLPQREIFQPPLPVGIPPPYGLWQFPEKLIPVVILKAAAGEPIPLYGDGQNMRDWLTVDDHVDALLLAACRGELGPSPCVGGRLGVLAATG